MSNSSLKPIELNNQIMKRGEDGFFQLEKDAEAVQAFMQEVSKNSPNWGETSERILSLIESNYYEDFTRRYSRQDIKEIFELALSMDTDFASFMAATKFYKDYAMRSNDGKMYLEDRPDRVAATALHLAQGNMDVARTLTVSMMENRLQPATPTFLNAGKARRGEMVSCFLLEMDDSLNSINYVLGTCMQLSKIGGGVAVNLSKLRGRGEPIKGVDGAAKGIMPVMKLMEDAFSYADQMGQRKGSGAAYYNIFGWDLMEFLDSKKINADEKIRLKTLSTGLIVPNIFYKLAKENRDFVVFAPYTIYKAYGQHMDDMDMDEMYETFLADKRVKKKSILNPNGKPMTARELLVKIAALQLESGYPYFMNRTNANKNHALKDLGTIKMSNLCTEIFQLQETSTINDFGEEHQIRRDISCNLASLNIVNVMEKKKVKESVKEGMIALTAVSDMSRVPNAPGVVKANSELHSVGLGAMNLHGFLAKNKIAFESADAREFTGTFFMMMNFYSLEASMEIARDRKETFKGFDRSEYSKGTYFNKYTESDFRPKSEKVKALFEGMHIPGPDDWSELKVRVMTYGLYHAYRMAVAPTQSISYVQNSTSSVMPAVEQIETRTYANSTTYYPMPFLSKDNMFFYKSAYNMNQYRIIDLIAEAQQHVDQGISTILHVNSDITTSELARYYVYAAEKGLKSLYYTRTNNLGVDECISCAV